MSGRACKDCRFLVTGQHVNPSFGHCRYLPPLMNGPAVFWPSVLIADQTVKNQQQEDVTEHAKNCWCWSFKPRRRWWQFWK